MSKLVDRLTAKWDDGGALFREGDPTCEAVARWWLNAIADELTEEDKSRMYRRYTSAVGYLRTQAEEES